MITFFTTTKPFKGQNKINQLNALRNWKQVVPDCEIIVFDELNLDGQLVKELHLNNVTEVRKYNGQLPFVNDMFNKASKISPHKICCFVNADILLPSNFQQLVLKIHEKLSSGYLLVGQRYDFDIDYEIEFEKQWEDELLRRHKENMVIHPPFGSDYFIFPKGLYLQNEIPELIVGRPGWDNWFIYNGVAEKKIKVIDITNELIVYHQNHPSTYISTSLTETNIDNATKHNLKYLPEKEAYDYLLDKANYTLVGDKITKRKGRTVLGSIKSVLKKVSAYKSDKI